MNKIESAYDRIPDKRTRMEVNSFFLGYVEALLRFHVLEAHTHQPLRLAVPEGFVDYTDLYGPWIKNQAITVMSRDCLEFSRTSALAPILELHIWDRCQAVTQSRTCAFWCAGFSFAQARNAGIGFEGATPNAAMLTAAAREYHPANLVFHRSGRPDRRGTFSLI